MNATPRELVESLIRDVPDFPEPGVVFKDITPLLDDPRGFAAAVDMMVEPWVGAGVSKVIGIEARGFMLATPIAQRLAVGFEERGQLTARNDLRLRMERDFALAGGGTLRHVAVPRIGWALVSQTDQSGHPLLVPATALPQRRLRQLEDALQGGAAVEARHPQVEEHQVGGRRGEHVEALRAAGALHVLVAAAEGAHDAAPRRGLVVDNQDACRGPRHPGSTPFTA